MFIPSRFASSQVQLECIAALKDNLYTSRHRYNISLPAILERYSFVKKMR